MPGIDDRETHLYRDYDTKGRISQSFHQKAALAGIKNLETISFRKDSPIKQTQSRFPEKYMNTMLSKNGSKTNYSSRRPSKGFDGSLNRNLASHMLQSMDDP